MTKVTSGYPPNRTPALLLGVGVLGFGAGTVFALLQRRHSPGLHRSIDPQFVQPIGPEQCYEYKGTSPFDVVAARYKIKGAIAADSLSNFIEEDKDPCEPEGVIIINGNLFFVKSSFPTSIVFNRIFDQLSTVLNEKFSSFKSAIVVPEPTMLQTKEDAKLLVATRQIKTSDGPFRSLRFDEFQNLKRTYRETPDILSMILVALYIVPHLHTRDMGVCKFPTVTALCVLDVDSTDFSLLTFESTSSSLNRLIKENIPILHDDSITKAISILRRFRDEIPNIDFSPFELITGEVLTENGEAIIDYMKNDRGNRYQHKDEDYKNNPEKSFNNLLAILETQTTPQLLQEALALRIDSGINALEAAKEVENLYRLYEFESQLRQSVIRHSEIQHNSSQEEIESRLAIAAKLDEQVKMLKELHEQIDPNTASFAQQQELMKMTEETNNEILKYRQEFNLYFVNATHPLFALESAIKMFRENTRSSMPVDRKKSEL